MISTRKRREQANRARREGVFDPREIQDKTLILRQNHELLVDMHGVLSQ